MKSTSRELYAALLSTAVILCFVFLSSGWLAPQRHQALDSSERIDDNSDWWSIIGVDADDFNSKPQNLETDASNFQIGSPWARMNFPPLQPR